MRLSTRADKTSRGCNEENSKRTPVTGVCAHERVRERKRGREIGREERERESERERGEGRKSDMRKIQRYRDDISQEGSRVETASDVGRVNTLRTVSNGLAVTQAPGCLARNEAGAIRRK